MKYSQLLLFTLISVVINDAFSYIMASGNLNIESSTYITIVLIYFSIFIFIHIASKEGLKRSNLPQSIKILFLLWLVCNVISLIIGMFTAVDYWDWKFIFLSSISFSLISLTFFIGNNLYLAKKSFYFVLKFIFPVAFIFIPIGLISNEQLYSRIVIPVSLFMLLIPYIKFRWKLIIIIVMITSVIAAIGFRANLIKISFSFLFLFFFYFRNTFRSVPFKLLHISFFILPLVLFTLGILGNYNFFTVLESKNKSGYSTVKNGKEADLLGDTRTFIYREVLLSLNKSGHFILGEGAAGKYQSKYFGNNNDNRGRYGSEVGILNILLFDGIVGVLIYFLLLFRVSFIAIYRSNNYLSKMLGLYIASRFLLSFIEEYTQYDINFYFFWIAIGLVSSTQFRAMSDQQLKTYFLFDGTKKSSRTPYLLQQED